MKRGKIRVGVIFGGRSGEHEVSLVSAASVMAAMDRQKYEVIPIGITKNGVWLTSGDPMKILRDGASVPRLSEITKDDRTSPGLAVPRRDLLPGTRKHGFPQVDVVFPVLHGPYGEDGTVQGLFELADIPYVGAGVLGSALGMDKSLMKEVFKAAGLPIVKYLTVKRKDWERRPDEVLNQIEEKIGYPCFTKPANLGSSVGVSKNHNREQLRQGMKLAADYDRKIVIERAVPKAREIECSVLGNDDPIASVLGEIVPCNEFYDYAAKYLDDRSKLIIPADLPEEDSEMIRDLALRAFLAVDCAGMARVDFLVNGNTGEVFVNELNTIPGFTSISMYPKLWEASGLPFSELIDRLIDLALERYEDKRRTKVSYEG